MRNNILDILVCPLCSSVFDLEQTQQEPKRDILSGALRCQGCGVSFPISNGIPRLLPSFARHEDSLRKKYQQASGTERTAATFGYEFSHFSQPANEENRLLFFRKTGIDEDFYAVLKNASKGDSMTVTQSSYQPNGQLLKGKLILDVGCGMGRFAAIARDYAREVVGFDVSTAVDEAQSRYGHHPNIQFVQGDILHPPFRHGAFDFVYSLGVLHHTECTARAFQQAASLCRSGGHLAVWVYPPGYWNDAIRGSVAKALRLVTGRLSPQRLHTFCRLLHPLGRLQVFLARSRWTKILGSPFFLIPVPRDQVRGRVDLGVIYDYYSPRYIWTHTAAEVFDWYVENGFKEIRILPVETAVLGRKSVN